MKRSSPVLWLIISAAFGVLSNLIASGLEQRYQLISNQTRWLIVVGTFLTSFVILAWFEYRREQGDGRGTINKLITGFGTKTGEIRMTVRGVLSDADVNTVELGSKTETQRIEMEYEGDAAE